MTRKKRSTSKALVAANPQANVPAYLQTDAPEGMDVVKQNLPQQFLGCVADTARSPVMKQCKEDYGAGAAVLTPTGVCAAELGEEFVAIPLDCFVMYVKAPHFDDEENMPERTFDANSEIARRAMNPNLRYEDYEDGRKDRKKNIMQWVYYKSLCYPLLIQTGGAAGELCLVEFNKGEYKSGTKLNSILKRRGTHIWANRIAFTPAVHTNGSDEWYGFDFSTPADGDEYVDEDLAPQIQAMHHDVRETREEMMALLAAAEQQDDAEAE